MEWTMELSTFPIISIFVMVWHSHELASTQHTFPSWYFHSWQLMKKKLKKMLNVENRQLVLDGWKLESIQTAKKLEHIAIGYFNVHVIHSRQIFIFQKSFLGVFSPYCRRELKKAQRKEAVPTTIHIFLQIVNFQ